jgi:hypothetical protein
MLPAAEARCDLRSLSLSLSLGGGNFLDAFAKLQKATISFAMSVCLSVRVEQIGSHLTNFH